ncbi:MAG TPA: serine hydrolase domain-containing protein [Bacteroidales bacterium]|nr:serine hydrolase domain-containing protein [Bacteroidales bacterium]
MKSKKKILLVFILVMLASYNPSALHRSDLITAKLVPENIRLSNSLSSGKEFASVEKTVKSFMRKWSIAGASISISVDGRLVYAHGFGYADTTTREEVQPYHKFRIASISKLITGIAVMSLVEEGKLSLNDRVFGPDAILSDPWFSNPRDKRVYGITVGHLLSHEGGWTQRWGDQMFMPVIIAENMGVKPPADTRTIIRYALDKRLHFTPGTGRAYSNLGYSILGLVIEKVSGTTYEDYCRKHVLEPVGIYDMTIARNLPSGKAPFEVTYYTPADVPPKPSIYGTGELVSPAYGGNDIEALGAAGAWIATSPDLIRLMLAVDGFTSHDDILSQESIEIMTDNGKGYAPVGWKTTSYNGTWWRTGSFPGSAGIMKRQPDGVSWVVLFNSSAWNGPEIYTSINNMMYRVLAQVKHWPEKDLFDNAPPLPLKTYLPEILTEK